MKGKLESISEIKQLQSGSGKKGHWTLWGCNITVDGKEYGVTDFKKEDLEKKTAKLKTGSVLEFETEQRGDYTNVKQKTEIKVLEEGTGQAGPAPAPTPDKPKMTDKEIERIWGETEDAVRGHLKERRVVVEGFDQIGPSVNTIYITKMKVRGIR